MSNTCWWHQERDTTLGENTQFGNVKLGIPTLPPPEMTPNQPQYSEIINNQRALAQAILADPTLAQRLPRSFIDAHRADLWILAQSFDWYRGYVWVILQEMHNYKMWYNGWNPLSREQAIPYFARLKLRSAVVIFPWDFHDEIISMNGRYREIMSEDESFWRKYRIYQSR